jgi:hypothetical protein
LNAIVIPNWLAIVESIVKILAVLGVASWTLYLYFALHQWSRARLESEKLRLERDKVEREVQKINREIQRLDLDLKAQTVAEIRVTGSQLMLSGDSGKILSVIVEVANRGTRPVHLDYKQNPKPCAVTQVSFAASGEPVFGESIHLEVPQAAAPNFPALSTTIRPSATEILPFVCHVKSAGVYLVTFRVQITAEEHRELQEFGILMVIVYRVENREKMSSNDLPV